MHIVSLSANVEKFLRFACLFLRFALCKFCEEKNIVWKKLPCFSPKVVIWWQKQGNLRKILKRFQETTLIKNRYWKDQTQNYSFVNRLVIVPASSLTIIRYTPFASELTSIWPKEIWLIGICLPVISNTFTILRSCIPSRCRISLTGLG